MNIANNINQTASVQLPLMTAAPTSAGLFSSSLKCFWYESTPDQAVPLLTLFNFSTSGQRVTMPGKMGEMVVYIADLLYVK